VTYSVDLGWDAPSTSSDPVASYNVYRAPSGSSSYTELTSLTESQTTYTDNSVQPGDSYQYYVTSVDASGVESVPSNIAVASIP
jgi:fibronectin type 3 domain-containing protein